MDFHSFFRRKDFLNVEQVKANKLKPRNGCSQMLCTDEWIVPNNENMGLEVQLYWTGNGENCCLKSKKRRNWGLIKAIE